MPSIRINITKEISRQLLLDILTIAVESNGYALWYWEGFNMVNIDRDADLNVESITFNVEHFARRGDAIDHQTATYTITADDILDALERIMSDEIGRYFIAGYIMDYIRPAVMEDDAGYIDAEAADVIIQVAAFDEVVFG